MEPFEVGRIVEKNAIFGQRNLGLLASSEGTAGPSKLRNFQDSYRKPGIRGQQRSRIPGLIGETVSKR